MQGRFSGWKWPLLATNLLVLWTTSYTKQFEDFNFRIHSSRTSRSPGGGVCLKGEKRVEWETGLPPEGPASLCSAHVPCKGWPCSQLSCAHVMYARTRAHTRTHTHKAWVPLAFTLLEMALLLPAHPPCLPAFPPVCIFWLPLHT